MTPDNRFFVCPDCAAQFPPDTVHNCAATGQRLAAELLDCWLADNCPIRFSLPGKPDLELEAVTSGIGLLWLCRIAYRIRSRMNGIGRYKDRAELSRRVCGLLEPDYEI